MAKPNYSYEKRQKEIAKKKKKEDKKEEKRLSKLTNQADENQLALDNNDGLNIKSDD